MRVTVKELGGAQQWQHPDGVTVLDLGGSYDVPDDEHVRALLDDGWLEEEPVAAAVPPETTEHASDDVDVPADDEAGEGETGDGEAPRSHHRKGTHRKK